MPDTLLYQVVFNETELHTVPAENLASIPVRKYLRPARFMLSSRMNDREFEPSGAASPLRALTKWLGEQTAAFRPIRRFDFVHVISITKGRTETATWIMMTPEDKALGFLFTPAKGPRQDSKQALDWRQLAPEWAQLIPTSK